MKLKENGFSLAEIMIAIGLLGVISLIVMNLTKQSSKSSSKFQYDSELTLITNEMNAILSDPNKCLTTFTDATQGALPALPTTPTQNVLSPMGLSGTPSTIKKYMTSGGPYGNAAVNILNYSLDLNAIPDPLLKVTFENKKILGPSPVIKSIRMVVNQTAGIITSCRSLSSSSTDIWSHGVGNTIYYNSPNGNVGIGTSAPVVSLQVSGGLKIGTDSSTCSPGVNGTEGTQRYNYTTHKFEYCNGAIWTSMGGTSYAGMYVTNVYWGWACWHPNSVTGDCSCPAGSSGVMTGQAYNNQPWDMTITVCFYN